MSYDPSPIEPDNPLHGIRWRPILLGAALDNALSLALMLPLVLVFAGADAVSEDEAEAAQAVDAVIASPEFLLASLVAGLAITVFAAHWAAARAGQHHVRHGGWTAVVSACLGFAIVYGLGTPSDPPPPVWYEGGSLLLMLPAGWAGGWIAKRRADASA